MSIITEKYFMGHARRLEREAVRKHGKSFTATTIAAHASRHVLVTYGDGYLKVFGEWKLTMRRFAETISD